VLRHLRTLAVVGALLSALAAAGAWASIGFVRHYFPDKSVAPLYFELAAWSVLAVYLAMVAYFDSLKLWRKN
jgi:hypothetical protein